MREWHKTIWIAAFAAGCASTPQATPGQDAEAKQFGTDANLATLYVYRPGSNFGDRVEEASPVIYVDQQLIGSPLAGVFFVVRLKPGTHVLSGIANDQGKMTLQVQAGQLYFVSLRVVNGNSIYTPVSVQNGKQEVSACCTLYQNVDPNRESLFPTIQF